MVLYSQMSLQRGLNYHDITYDTAITVAEINHILEWQQTPHSSPSRASYAVSIVRILEKIDRVITVSPCIHSTSVCLYTGTISGSTFSFLLKFMWSMPRPMPAAIHPNTGTKATYAKALPLLLPSGKETSADWTLQWRHNGCDGVSNHQPLHCSLNHLFRSR